MVNFKQITMIFVGVSGAFSVLFGAWLSHQGHALTPDVVSRLKDAHFYQFIHTLALFAVTISWQDKSSKVFALTACLFMFGILLFSGSLYLKTFFAWQSIGKLAPIGGVLMSLAWLSLLFHLKNRNS